MVLGGDGEVLDLGRSRRLFTSKQKLALAERDGGCAWAGCPHPPSYTEAHHIRWWDKQHGPTDLNNGILLCSNHHHRVHDDGWDIQVRGHVPWFIPPSHIDHHRRPRRGGRIRLSDTQDAA
ncbi:HNH endonuclease [Leifsonia sp. NPDC058292]|uniref:HNH endonuclease n=1 Tax=Leifsonia sp. NPDC058292 TaxID=3346428 RepID=UPI0036D88A76